MKSEEELSQELDHWIASQPAPPTIFDVIKNGSAGLLGTYVLRGFRVAAAEAVEKRERAILVRAAAVDAFQGDTDAAEAWLRHRSGPLGNRTPLSVAVLSPAGTDVVLDLLQQLRG